MQHRFPRLMYYKTAYFSRPSSDRKLYRAIKRQKLGRILELGLGDGERALRMIHVARLGRPAAEVSYTAVDLFELGEQRGLSLKLAHRRLAATEARIRLLPGDPFSVLSRRANELVGTDLVVISADQEPVALAKAWFYVPRMLHQGTLVFHEQNGGAEAAGRMRLVPHEEIAALAAVPVARRAA